MKAAGSQVILLLLFLLSVGVHSLEKTDFRNVNLAQYEEEMRKLKNEQPLQLVSPNSDHSRLSLIEKNLEYLASINEPISIVGVVGPYHSGKSFLLNSFLQDTKGFRVGPTTSPETMGIWLLKTDLIASDNSRVLFLDTEGFFGSDIAEAYDAKIFAIVTLLSSHLIYNSVKVIDQQSVDYLELLSRRTQLFQLRNTVAANTNTSRELLDIIQGANFPKLTWVVKDFASNLAGKSANDWLFEYIRGHRDKEITGNELDKVFDNGIDCQTLFLPATDIDRLQDLSKVSASELTPEFRKDLLQLRQNILDNLKAKSTTRGLMTGPTLAALLRFLVLSANENRIPQLPSLWDSWVHQQVETSMQDALSSYRRDLNEIMSSGIPPSDSEFPGVHDRLVSKATKLYKDMLFGMEDQPGLERLKNSLDENFYHLRDANRDHIRETILRTKNDLLRRILPEFEDLDIPVDENELNTKYESLRKAVNGVFDERLGRYSDSPEFTEHRNALTNELAGKRDSILLRNRRAIDDVLQKAYDDYVSTYEQHITPVRNQMILPHDLERRHLVASEMAKNKFDADINKWKRNWIKYDNQYKSRLALAQQHAENLYQEMMTHNDDFVQRRANELRDRYDDEFEKSLKEIRPLPADEERLVERASDIANHLISEYNANMRNLHDSPFMAQKRDELKKLFVEDLAVFLDMNVKMLKSMSGDMFRCAKNRMQAELENHTFHTAYINPWTHRNLAVNSAEECFALDPKTATLPPSLRRKVILDWYQDELSDDRMNVYSNLMKLIFATVIGLVGLSAALVKYSEWSKEGIEYERLPVIVTPDPLNFDREESPKGYVIDDTPPSTATATFDEGRRPRGAPKNIPIS